MTRSDFLKSGATLVGGSLLIPDTNLYAQTNKKGGKPFNLDYAPHQGMFSATAGKNFIDEIKYYHDLGFRSIEDNGMPERPLAEQVKIGETLEKLGMRMGVFVVRKGGNGANTLTAGKQEHIDIFLKGCREAVEVAKRVNAKWVTVVPGDYQANLPMGLQTANVIEALKQGAALLEPHGITMVLEPLSDSPELFLRYTDQTYQICKAVDSPSCKILYDIYHQQKNEGNLIYNMETFWSEIAYVQLGDNPGRREPTTGEINFKNIFSCLKKKNYDGVVGMEHGMSKSGLPGEQALLAAYREVDNF